MKKLFLAFIAVLLVSPVSADLGPKPSAEFHLEYDMGKDLQLGGGDVYECQNRNCSRKRSASYLGFDCEDGVCQTINLGQGSRQVLVLNFVDKNRSSNIFTQEEFEADFEVHVKDDKLVVKETEKVFTPDRISNFAVALFITLIVELSLGVTFLAIYGRNRGIGIDRKLAATVGLASLITLPVVWFAFPLLKNYISPTAVKVSSESFAILAEALIIHKLNAEKISLKTGFYTSVIMNSFSVMIGILQALLFL